MSPASTMLFSLSAALVRVRGARALRTERTGGPRVHSGARARAFRTMRLSLVSANYSTMLMLLLLLLLSSSTTTTRILLLLLLLRLILVVVVVVEVVVVVVVVIIVLQRLLLLLPV